MRLSLITIEPGPGAAVPMDPATLIDLLWTTAAAGDRVEHIAARCRPDRIEIGVYSGHPDGPAAAAHALGLVGRALAAPALHRWMPVGAVDHSLLDI